MLPILPMTIDLVLWLIDLIKVTTDPNRKLKIVSSVFYIYKVPCKLSKDKGMPSDMYS